MPQKFVEIPSIYPKLLELRKSTTAAFKPNKYLKESTVLRYYQVVGALHMMLLQRMVLGDGTGLGKTIETIAAYTWSLLNNPNLKLLVVCPKSAMYQWAEEFEKFTTDISVRVITNDYQGFTGIQARKMQYSAFKEHVMVINYAPLIEEYEFIRQALSPNYMVIYDECQTFKNRKTRVHLACSLISEMAERVYGLSATIIKNSLEEVYCIYSVIVPGLFGNITRFRKNYCKQELMKLRIGGKERRIPKTVGYKNLQQFKQAIDPYFLIRRKEEVASELPKLISRKVILEMEPDQKRLYKEALSGIMYEEKIKREYYEISDKVRNGTSDEKTLKLYEERKDKYEKFMTEDGRKRGKLAALTYCQMISNGPSLVGQSGESSKENEFIRLMTEELVEEKVILFTRFKTGIPALEIACERNHISYTKITGDLNDSDRQSARLKFQNDPTCKIIFITTAGSASLNLQSAGVIIFYDTPWSYGDLVQTIGRAQRIGSLKEHILVLHMINKGTIDVRVINKVSGKKELSDEVIGDTAEGALDFTAQESGVIDDLFTQLMEDAENIE